MKHRKKHKIESAEIADLLNRCRNAILKIDPEAKVILYGSRARGDEEPESDYDLLILTEGEATLRREDIFRRQLYPIEIETGAVITVMLVKNKDWNSDLYKAMPFHQNVEREGLVL